MLNQVGSATSSNMYLRELAPREQKKEANSFLDKIWQCFKKIIHMISCGFLCKTTTTLNQSERTITCQAGETDIERACRKINRDPAQAFTEYEKATRANKDAFAAFIVNNFWNQLTSKESAERIFFMAWWPLNVNTLKSIINQGYNLKEIKINPLIILSNYNKTISKEKRMDYLEIARFFIEKNPDLVNKIEKGSDLNNIRSPLKDAIHSYKLNPDNGVFIQLLLDNGADENILKTEEKDILEGYKKAQNEQ